jgi:MIP family channel proteins
MKNFQRRAGQRYWAEFIGTFAIVFVACGAVISDKVSHGAVTLLGIALAPGFMVAAMVYALGPISAAHFNPAVTLGFAVARRFPWRYVLPYLLAQVAGALLASALHAFIYGVDGAMQADYGAHFPAVSIGAAILFEVIITFFLMLVIMAVATDKRANSAVAGLAIGLTVAVCILFGAAITGASMNPARSLAPALFAGKRALIHLPIYLVGPPLGAILAALGYEALRDGQTHAQSAPADLL